MSSMEQEVARWLHTQLGYNVAADTTLSANCRGNLRGLWDFLIANYKTGDTKRHIQHVLERHRREQEAARRAPEQQREAQARRQRLQQARTRAAELQQTLTSLQVRVEGHVHEVVDQASEHALLQHDLQEVECQALLLQAFVQRNGRLLPQLQAKLAQLHSALMIAQARCQAAGSDSVVQGVQQQLAQLSASIQQGLEKAADERLMQHNGALRDLQPVVDQHTRDQHHQQEPGGVDAAAPLQSPLGLLQPLQQQQQAAAAAGANGLQAALQRCRLLSGYKLPEEVRAAATQLLQQPPGLLWACTSQLAAAGLQEVSALLDAAEGEIMAPLAWPLAAAGSDAADQRDSDQQQPQQQQHWDQHRAPRQQQLGADGGGGAGQQRRQQQQARPLPWASGVSTVIAAAYAARGVAPPPEIRVRMRQMQHVQLFVAAREAGKRGAAAARELYTVLGSTPLLQVVAAGGAGAAPGEAGACGGWEAQLAQLHLRVAALLGQLGALRRFESEYAGEAGMLAEAEEAYGEKLAKVEDKTLADEQLNLVLAHVSHDVFEVFRALSAQQGQAAGLLAQLLAPCGAAAAGAAARGVGRLLWEVGAAGRLPLGDLVVPAALAAGADVVQAGARGAAAGGADSGPNPVLQRPTLGRLALAAQQLLLDCRGTTGGAAGGAAPAGRAGSMMPAALDMGLLHGPAAEAALGANGLGGDVEGLGLQPGGSRGGGDGHRRRADAAAVNALRGATALDALAAARCPTALLVCVAERCQQFRQQEQRVHSLSSAGAAAAAGTSEAAEAATRLQEEVAVLHEAERGAVVPHLSALLEAVQSAQAFAASDVTSDSDHLWEQPAMHLLPGRTYDGRNCTQWLEEVQVLRAQRQELGSMQRVG